MADGFFLYAILVIWIMLVINILLTIAGHRYYLATLREDVSFFLPEYPMVSILVPAHNESKVIRNTVEALLRFDYPPERYEIIIVNDNSSDDTGTVLQKVQEEHPGRNLTVITTDKKTGGRGKSNALNIGFSKSRGSLIAVYDADNTPEKTALRYLVNVIEQDARLGAVIGKFRTRNRKVNLLTRFVNIETLTFQWMAQAGRWKLFRLCTIPGTNFVVRRSILEKIGGWDVKAIAEDTEISFRIYQMGYRIRYLPQSVTWEQEPQTIPVWIKQRTRWATGNFYVLMKNLKLLFDLRRNSVKFDVVYYLFVYILFLSSIIISDICFVLGAFGLLHLTVQGSSVILWVLAYGIFVLSVSVTLLTEKGETGPGNFLLVMVMYFTYCQLWMVAATLGLVGYVRNVVLHRQMRWYKTERF